MARRKVRHTNCMKEIQKTIRLEGGYVNDPNDPGGETKYGIAKRNHPDVDIKSLTPELAEAIYKVEYWDKLHCDGYSNVQFRWKLFDIAVNQGPGTAMAFVTKIRSLDTLQGTIELMRMQMQRYIQIVIAKPTQLAYLRGWSNRSMDLGEDLL